MKTLKRPLLFTLALLPAAAVGGYFVTLYQLESYDAATVAQLIGQIGSLEMLTVITVLQTVLYALFCGIVGGLLAQSMGLLRPFAFEKKGLLHCVLLSLAGGAVFSLDPWVFGAWIPAVKESAATPATVNAWLASVLYGGIMEELMLRLFFMSLLAWLGWKLFFRQKETVPAGVLIAANVVAAMLFAAGHLPATAILFGRLTPVILLRCFLLNGGFGLLFGRLYRKYGIQYAMLSHALLHIVSKTVWLLFC
ncbi:MAG: CPBP family intramembrane metalloprotease [Oscillospiraceae bacterium]|nr:CPBP family intramembrane metalloprotease [Oscillospiraceae bacterium]